MFQLAHGALVLHVPYLVQDPVYVRTSLATA